MTADTARLTVTGQSTAQSTEMEVRHSTACNHYPDSLRPPHHNSQYPSASSQAPFHISNAQIEISPSTLLRALFQFMVLADSLKDAEHSIGKIFIS